MRISDWSSDVCSSDLGKADQLRDLGVGVDPGENVLALAQRVQNLLVAQALGQAQPASVAGAGVKLGEALVDAAMLAVEHRLDLIVVERGEDAVDIVAEAGGDADRLLVAAEGLGVEQSGVELVPVVRSEEHTSELQSLM